MYFLHFLLDQLFKPILSLTLDCCFLSLVWSVLYDWAALLFIVTLQPILLQKLLICSDDVVVEYYRYFKSAAIQKFVVLLVRRFFV